MDSVFSNIDLDLLKKFDKPGPRYTSYPTAPMFSPEYTDKQFEIDLIRNNDENSTPLSLYVHIPFCDTLCYFCGCTTLVTSRRDKISAYLSNLKTEIERTSFYVDRGRPVTQIHWGGGTPSYLHPEEILDLGTFIAQRFAVAPNAEFSVEIDPRGLTYDHMSVFRKIGVNRVSLGVQDFDARVQAAVNRVQPEEMTTRAIQWARTLGIRSVNIDVIYGLPLQCVSSFQYTLDEIVAISPERIAAFNFAYLPSIKLHQKLIHPEDLPSPETKLKLLKATIENLTGAGYYYIGMDHFAKPNDELSIAQKGKTLHRNFQGYSTQAGADLYGFGMSAISHFGNVYAQNAKTISDYEGRLQNCRFPTQVGYRMNDDDGVRKFVIMRLMCDLEVNKQEIEERYRISFDEYFREALERLADFQRLGLVRQDFNTISVAGAGRLLLRNIAMCFDAYLPQDLKAVQLFSKTV